MTIQNQKSRLAAAWGRVQRGTWQRIARGSDGMGESRRVWGPRR